MNNTNNEIVTALTACVSRLGWHEEQLISFPLDVAARKLGEEALQAHAAEQLTPEDYELLEELAPAKHWLVTLDVQCGEFHKRARHLVVADTYDEAVEQAVRDESHNREDDTPADDYGWYEDAGGQLSYRASRVIPVDNFDVDTLRKYL